MIPPRAGPSRYGPHIDSLFVLEGAVCDDGELHLVLFDVQDVRVGIHVVQPEPEKWTVW